MVARRIQSRKDEEKEYLNTDEAYRYQQSSTTTHRHTLPLAERARVITLCQTVKNVDTRKVSVK